MSTTTSVGSSLPKFTCYESNKIELKMDQEDREILNQAQVVTGSPQDLLKTAQRMEDITLKYPYAYSLCALKDAKTGDLLSWSQIKHDFIDNKFQTSRMNVYKTVDFADVHGLKNEPKSINIDGNTTNFPINLEKVQVVFIKSVSYELLRFTFPHEKFVVVPCTTSFDTSVYIIENNAKQNILLFSGGYPKDADTASLTSNGYCTVFNEKEFLDNETQDVLNSINKLCKMDPNNNAVQSVNPYRVLLVKFPTAEGEKIQLRGEGAEGLSWNQGGDLTPVAPGVWALGTNLDLSKVQAKFVHVSKEGKVTWEREGKGNRELTNAAIQTFVPDLEGAHVPSEGKQELTREHFILHFKTDTNSKEHFKVRGWGGGLSWEKGVPLTYIGDDLWVFTMDCEKDEKIAYKIVREVPHTDVKWEQGEDRRIAAGQSAEIIEAKTPEFS